MVAQAVQALAPQITPATNREEEPIPADRSCRTVSPLSAQRRRCLSPPSFATPQIPQNRLICPSEAPQWALLADQ